MGNLTFGTIPATVIFSRISLLSFVLLDVLLFIFSIFVRLFSGLEICVIAIFCDLGHELTKRHLQDKIPKPAERLEQSNVEEKDPTKAKQEKLLGTDSTLAVEKTQSPELSLKDDGTQVDEPQQSPRA
ncbi:unnamed protein product, partial [Gongylonema pulchrum]|uniref:Transmembrane protein n=1 Tax=Gongylonema pulchrum TaxID=637853 RepID=A0A183DKF2_9BILA